MLFSKTSVFKLKLLWLHFGPVAEIFGLLFIPTSGHTKWNGKCERSLLFYFYFFQCVIFVLPKARDFNTLYTVLSLELVEFFGLTFSRLFKSL